ncbi:hypothetical protein FHX74_000463 [Friedmanniella endophytica]|uniref:4Fe-4S Wbl-type domain-containing protein n=1 Tax=Microlunatus kandeliicorticis TaxID=1759536 RepID=A0A7W3P4F3_9ACTN|nr:WhiB family transcriptional regulator [Microlunatus kandeliicorticis]MBA8792869.1 hypothetical protein [Microlunatus kandeliicorticis]
MSDTPVDGSVIMTLAEQQYRASVIRQLQISVDWQLVEWVDGAACRDSGRADRPTCARCPVRAECLAAALVAGDTAEWRGGADREERAGLWEDLERVYLGHRDRGFMQLDRSLTGRWG